jgi:hypothetical protein
MDLKVTGATEPVESKAPRLISAQAEAMAAEKHVFQNTYWKVASQRDLMSAPASSWPSAISGATRTRAVIPNPRKKALAMTWALGDASHALILSSMVFF